MTSRRTELFLKLLITESFCLAMIAPLFIVLPNLDALSDYLFPKLALRSFGYCFVRYVALVLVMIEITKSVATFLILGKIMLACSTRAALGLNEHIKIGGNLLLASRMYYQLGLFNQFLNSEFCSNSMPPIILFGTGLIILLNYGTIRFYGRISNLIYPFIPFVNIVTYFFPLILLPETVNVIEKSAKFLATARHKKLTKYEKRVIYSLKAVGIRCGEFGVVSTSWATKLVETGLNYTATMLLTF